MGKTLIQGAHVLTMDDRLGSLPRGDVLIDGDRIAAVGVGLPRRGRRGDRRREPDRPAWIRRHAPPHVGGDACVVAPATAISARTSMTSSSPTARTSRPRTPTPRSGSGWRRRSTPAITTLHAWEHNLQTRQHAEAALTAFEESGLRGRFSYGPSSDPQAGSSFAQGTETIDFEHVLELSKTRFASGRPAPPRDRLPRRRVLPAGDLAGGVRVRSRAPSAIHDAHDDDETRRRASARDPAVRGARRARAGSPAHPRDPRQRGRDPGARQRPRHRSRCRSSPSCAPAWASRPSSRCCAPA